MKRIAQGISQFLGEDFKLVAGLQSQAGQKGLHFSDRINIMDCIKGSSLLPNFLAGPVVFFAGTGLS